MENSILSITFWQKYLDKIGVGGTLFAALCCLGFPALLSILTALGLGFLINDTILRPLLIIFLILSLIGLYSGIKVHHKPWAFVLGLVSSVMVYYFIYVHYINELAIVSIILLVSASILNIWFRMRDLKKANRKN